MKAPKFISAMAIAAILSSGVSPAYADFQVDTGNTINGQPYMQKAEESEIFNNGGSNGPNTPPNVNHVQGDIEVSGEFNKTINSFPTPDKDGRYLRVTMPIKMDFTYNVDNNTMTSAKGTITNNSVYVENAGSGQAKETPQAIKMSLVDITKNGTGSTNSIDTEFVDTIRNNNNNNKVLLPFKLDVSNGTNGTTSYNLTKIESKNNNISEIVVQPGGIVDLQLGLITGETIGNANLINTNKSITSHNLKLKFEYNGK